MDNDKQKPDLDQPGEQLLTDTGLSVGVVQTRYVKLFEGDQKLKKMQYRFNLASESGRRFFFDGFKRIKDEKGVDVWGDTTTLYITIYEGNDETGAIAAKGKLFIAKTDFVRQMTTMKATTSEGDTSVRGTAKFGAFFAGELWSTYGAEAIS